MSFKSTTARLLLVLVLTLAVALVPSAAAFAATDASLEETSTQAAVADADATAAAEQQDVTAEPTADEPVTQEDTDAAGAEHTKARPEQAGASDGAGDGAGNGANNSGPYDSTSDGSPSGNGNGDGNANGKPCAGCVGNADDKNPPGQLPGPEDHNKGYECDENSGVGKTNPAHSGCKDAEEPTAPAIHLEKDGDKTSRVGETVTYTFSVTN